MHVSKRTAMALLTTAALAGSAASAMSAAADPGGAQHGGPGVTHLHAGSTLLDTSLAPSVPTDPVLFGSAAGGAPWVLRLGRADLRSNGRLEVVIRGLVIPVAPFNGTAGPVTTVDAALYCNGSSTPAATSPSVPISTKGDATINAKLMLPSTCLAPAFLIHPNGASNIYIAASGFTG